MTSCGFPSSLLSTVYETVRRRRNAFKQIIFLCLSQFLDGSTSVMVGGTTYYKACNLQSNGHSKTLDATAPPFESAYTGSIVTEEITEESVHGIAHHGEHDNTHHPGDAFRFPQPSNNDMERNQFIHKKLRQV